MGAVVTESENVEENPSIEESPISATVEWTVWHLTPKGWARGSHKNEFEGAHDITPPKDRVLSCLYKECLADKWKVEVDETYRSKGEEHSITQLLQKFGPSPQSL